MGLLVNAFLLYHLSTIVSGSFNQVELYDEMQKLVNPCFPKDTCRSLKATSEDHMWQPNRTCECGRHCLRHQTCCVDSNYFGMNRLVPKPYEQECRKVKTRELMVYMVSTCLPGWSEDSIYEKCVDPDHDLKDYLSQVPVTSLTSMTTYGNYFCALCNNDSDSAVAWDIGITDSGKDETTSKDDCREKMQYDPAHGSWGFFQVESQTKRLQFRKCEIKFYVREDLRKFVKPCHPKMISKCNPSDESTLLRHKCEAYYSPIRGRQLSSGRVASYRNIHCALCNGLKPNVDEFSCLINKRKKSNLSFTKLVDVNIGDGVNVGKTSVCNAGQVYDPRFQKCRKLVCAMPGYVMKGGSCVPPA